MKYNYVIFGKNSTIAFCINFVILDTMIIFQLSKRVVKEMQDLFCGKAAVGENNKNIDKKKIENKRLNEKSKAKLSTENEKLLREEYIDGMKGLACLFVLLGHFTGIYKYAENFSTIDSWFMRMLTNGPLSFFSAESYWMQLFLVISGYLTIRYNPPKTCKAFFKKCVKRVFRLAIPVAGTAVFVLALQNTIGFYNFKIQNIIQNTWITRLYGTTLTVTDAIKEPFEVLFMGICKFNSPFWCLRDMLIAALLIYLVTWICKTIKMRGCALGILMLAAILMHREVIVACLLGSAVGLLRSQTVILKIPSVIAVCGIFAPIAAFFSHNLFVMDIGFAFYLMSVPFVSCVKQFWEKTVVKKIGSISFGIYALHWPVTNSFGMGLIYGLSDALNPAVLMALSLAVILIVTFLLAVLFKVTIERLTSIVCRNIAEI